MQKETLKREVIKETDLIMLRPEPENSFILSKKHELVGQVAKQDISENACIYREYV